MDRACTCGVRWGQWDCHSVAGPSSPDGDGARPGVVARRHPAGPDLMETSPARRTGWATGSGERMMESDRSSGGPGATLVETVRNPQFRQQLSGAKKVRADRAYRNPRGERVRRDPGGGDAEDGGAADRAGLRGGRRGGAGAGAEFPDEAYAAAGAGIAPADEVWTATWCCRSTSRARPRSPGCARARGASARMAAGRSARAVRGAERQAGHRALAGRDSADLPGAVDGRAVHDVEHRRLPRGDRGRGVLWRDVQPARSPRPGRPSRPRFSSSAPASPGWPRSAPRAASAPRSGRSTSGPRWPSRSSRWARRSSPRSGGQQEVSADGYARALTEDQAAQTARVYAAESAKVRHRRHHRAGPRQGADHDHRRHGREHEARQRDRRPRGVRRRQLRADRAGREDRHRQRGDDHRLHRPGQPDADAHLPALRHEPRQPAQAAHPGQGRAAGARHGRRRPAVDHGHPGRRDPVAAAAGAGLRRAEAGARPRPPPRRPDPGGARRAGHAQAAAPVRAVRPRRGGGRARRSRSRRRASSGSSRCSCSRCSSAST